MSTNLELNILNVDGKETGEQVHLNEAIFGLEPNQHAIYMDVKQHLANRRQGTHKVKEKGEVRGSTRKLYRQKGTGNARRGQIRSPLLRGGGTVHGPRPRDYGFKLNKKLKRLARKSALSYKLREEAVSVVESFTFDAPKTRNLVAILYQLGLADTKTLLVTGPNDDNLYLSGRNLPKLHIEAANRLNTYTILNCERVLFLADALPLLEQTLLETSTQEIQAA